MRKVTVEEIAGTWRSKDEHICFDLTIRPGGVSFFSQIKLSERKVIFEEQGECKLVENRKTDDISIWIDERFELVIWQLKTMKLFLN